MNALAKKLHLKPGESVRVINLPRGLDLGLPQAAPRGSAAAVLLFAADKAELGRCLPAALKAVAEEGRIWIAYPKGTSKVASDLNRDSLWKECDGRGLTGVSLIAIDATWSAMRFRRKAANAI
jgi:hypothetical protein